MRSGCCRWVISANKNVTTKRWGCHHVAAALEDAPQLRQVRLPLRRNARLPVVRKQLRSKCGARMTVRMPDCSPSAKVAQSSATRGNDDSSCALHP